MKLPKVRTTNIVVRELEKEILIYDLIANKAFVLNETSAIVCQDCGKNKFFANLQADFKFSNDLIYLSLEQSDKQNLLADNSFVSSFAGVERREVIRRIGAASMIALTIISSPVAPTSAHAASSCVNPGGLPPGAPTNYSCSGTTASCETTCSTDILAQGDCCSGNSELQSGCAEFTPCP